MKLVIDIPEEMYQKIKDTNMVISGRRSGRTFDYVLFNAIHNGIPLDKIKAEIDAIDVRGRINEYDLFVRSADGVKQMALDIIDKYKTESEVTNDTRNN